MLDYSKFLELLLATKAKYKNDYTQHKDLEKARLAIIIINALNEERRHIEEILDVNRRSH